MTSPATIDDEKKMPVRAFRLTLALDADTRAGIVDRLIELSRRVDRDEICRSVCGGPDDGWIVELLHDPEQTHDRYHRQIRDALRPTPIEHRPDPHAPHPPAQQSGEAVAWRVRTKKLKMFGAWNSGAPSADDIESASQNGWSIQLAYATPQRVEVPAEVMEAAESVHRALTPFGGLLTIGNRPIDTILSWLKSINGEAV